MDRNPQQTIDEAEGHPIQVQIEETVKQFKNDVIQNQLENLKISIDNLAQTPEHADANTIPGLYWAILKGLSILADHCMMENIDRYDQSAFQQRHRQIQNLSSSITDDDSDPDCLRFVEEVGRQNFLRIVLRDSLPSPEWCFPPYDASGKFISRANIFRSLFFHELKGSPSDDASVTAMPEDSPSKKPMDSPELDLSRYAEYQDCRNKKWVKEQFDSYERYVQLPVNDDVLCQALQEYEFCRDGRERLSKGLNLHGLAVRNGDQWSYVSEHHPAAPPSGTMEVITMTRARLRTEWNGPASLKEEAPATHPAITNLKLDFEKLIAPEYGIVVAWKYFESDPWMDRYGHLV
ncbi:uncharacterized protein B0J16DRAFT_404875 [Fusarium flagelliforme]|uniref:Uncharacterized protein n=1 Tax=Fusarium flagelliforme TaxID=2675880 RepID=A0A395MCP2_9HYPO|nr:uncharacterized protein B0J16DRAFT_404875 [Fusarium flagelliforme]KAH7174973.1 hypothetical protein B0J16DRAFT_404875 [Fusarium flagelliforme]RFN44869.1 hypothetical protein FIE12Z_10850 [Fusarium flagelliforme]